MDQVEFFSMDNMKNNTTVFTFCHTFMCIVGGCIAGIMGLNGINGFVFFGLLFSITSLGLFVKMNFDVKAYSNASNYITFAFQGIGGHVLSYILFWTLANSLVHIY